MYKRGDETQPGNYRPNSLLSVFNFTTVQFVKKQDFYMKKQLFYKIYFCKKAAFSCKNPAFLLNFVKKELHALPLDHLTNPFIEDGLFSIAWFELY